MFETLADMRRLIHAARVLARHDALLPREYAQMVPAPLRTMRWLFGRPSAKERSIPAGERLARALESLGPGYIKLGQVLATRPDIMGEEIARSLEALQDHLPSFPIEAAQTEVETGLGRPLQTVFAFFGEPVAAASIAQVHPAETAEDPPRRVAVKVLRPGIERQFARDLSAFALAARMAERFSSEARRLRVTEVVRTLARTVAVELDLRMEAAAASELAELTRGDALFRVPAIDWERTAQRVMTIEWVDGTQIRSPRELEAAGHDPRAIAVLVIRSFLTQALRDGFFHADMHQGNLFVDSEGRLVAVDFGIMGRLDQEMRRFLAETLAGFLARDYMRVAQVHFEAGFVPRSHPLELFAQALRAIGEPIFGRNAREVSMAKVLQQLFETTRRFDMELQPQLVLLQKTMVVAEGVARALDTEFDIWEASRPIVERWMIDNLGPEARLRDAAVGVSALGRLARDLPQALKNAEIISEMLAEGGLKLHPETAREIARAQVAGTRHVRIAMWMVAAGAIGLLAFGIL
jgi:ubiquinone biosynthesis protein